MRDELGAHVSTAGGVELAPGRASEIEAHNLQLFTKQPNRWFEPTVSEEGAVAFHSACRERDIDVAGSHDSYLINLASPDPALWTRSLDSFRGEMTRCSALGLDFLVTHPGNATDGDLDSGVDRNAEGLARALDDVPGETRILLELTAGAGTSVGGSFESLAAIMDRLPSGSETRMGVCFDTCHAYSAGYDLVKEYEDVWKRFEDVIGLERLSLFHLNDSRHPLGSHKDRHEQIGEGTLGDEPFRRIVTDSRFQGTPKILETPKGDDPVAFDRRNLGRLRAFRSS